ncbi:TPA: glycosyl transferase [Klebsiella pneumoniae]|nr:glycosyl transferase [Klebsiella pneumoniae]
MLKLTPGANKANAILIRIVLFLIGGIAIITGMCLFSGDMWMLTPRPIQHPILPLMILIAAGIFIFLHPEVTPGRDASIQYGKHNTYYASIFWMKTRSGSHSAKQSKYETFVEAKDPRWLIDRNNLRRAWRCEVQRHTQFYTLSFNEGWFPNGDPQVLANQCSQIADLDTVSEDELLVTKTIRSRK